ncbi:Autophagy-related protein 101, partial [Neolecta irregularis DAH-3]
QVCIDDAEIESLIGEKTSNFLRHFASQGWIEVKFMEKRTRKAWFSKSEEEVCWETWILVLNIVETRSDSERTMLMRDMKKGLRDALQRILNIVNEQKSHIPAIIGTDPFPYQVRRV